MSLYSLYFENHIFKKDSKCTEQPQYDLICTIEGSMYPIYRYITYQRSRNFQAIYYRSGWFKYICNFSVFQSFFPILNFEIIEVNI